MHQCQGRTEEPGAAEAAPENTDALIELIFAVGYSRLGQHSAAQTALQHGSARLSGGRPLLALLEHHYGERAALALAGRVVRRHGHPRAHARAAALRARGARLLTISIHLRLAHLECFTLSPWDYTA